jgi:hypothetical protein
MWVVMIVLASCQDVAEGTARSETVAVDAGYPSLYSVPPRPQLSYPVEQRRAIVDGLIADRENARYTSEVIRYRAGLSNLPPPEPRTVAAVPAVVEPEAQGAGAAPPSAPSEPPGADTPTELFPEDDSLGSFMQRMLDSAKPPGDTRADPKAEPRARATPPGDDPVPAEPAHDAKLATASSETLRVSPPPPAKPSSAAVTEIAVITAQEADEVEAADTDRAAPEAPSKPVPESAQIEVANGLIAIEVAPDDDRSMMLESIAFAPGSAALPPDAKARLAQFLGEASAQGARVKIVGEAEAADLALDRARAVGLALVQGGLPADRLEMSLADDGTGDRARLFLAAP